MVSVIVESLGLMMIGCSLGVSLMCLFNIGACSDQLLQKQERKDEI